MKQGGFAVIGVCLLGVWAAAARGQQSAPAASAPAGLKPHVRVVKGGTVDWTRGYVIASGMGRIARPGQANARPMAQRAAELDAARNALAIAAGIRVGPNGIADAVPNGRVAIRGVISQHKVIDVRWSPRANPTQCRLKLRVPLWGMRSVASVLVGNQKQVAAAAGPHLEIVAAGAAEEGEIIIDARGFRVSACLFPVLSEESGAILYDVTCLAGEAATSPARYAESELTFEGLQSLGPSPLFEDARLCGLPPAHSDPHDDARFDFETALCGAAGAWYAYVAEPPGAAPTQPAGSQPSASTAPAATQPSRRRIVVKAARAAGQDNTQIVLTKQDAERLRNTPDGAALLRAGKVVIVVDSAAAGIQGRAPVEADEWTPVLAVSR